MTRSAVFATKLPPALTAALDKVCSLLGLRKNHVVEVALRDKIEELLDGHDLQQAMKEATGFHAWSAIKKQLKL